MQAPWGTAIFRHAGGGHRGYDDPPADYTKFWFIVGGGMEEVVNVRPDGGVSLMLVGATEGIVITGQEVLAEANRMLSEFFTRYLPCVPRDDPDRHDLEDLAGLSHDLIGRGQPQPV